jgi:hypothetical protein
VGRLGKKKNKKKLGVSKEGGGFLHFFLEFFLDYFSKGRERERGGIQKWREKKERKGGGGRKREERMISKYEGKDNDTDMARSFVNRGGHAGGVFMHIAAVHVLPQANPRWLASPQAAATVGRSA